MYKSMRGGKTAPHFDCEKCGIIRNGMIYCLRGCDLDSLYKKALELICQH